MQSGIELVSPCPYPVMITITPRARRSDNLQTSYWSHPHYPFTPPKRGRLPSMFNMQSTSHSQAHSYKLWQVLSNLPKTLPKKQFKEPLQKLQTRRNLKLSKRNQPLHQNLVKYNKT